MRSLRMTWLVLAIGLLCAPAAWAQMDSREGIALQNQIYQLRQEVQNLRDAIARGGGGSAPSSSRGYSGGGDMVAQLLTRVDALEDQVRQLRGKVDQLEFQMQRADADLGKRIDDMAFQMGQPAAPGARQAAPAPVAPPLAAPGLAPTPLTPPAAAPSTPAPRTPEAALQAGNAALARRDYPAAEAAAKEVLANRTSPRAYDAQFLLAQSLAGQRQYPQAAIAFDDAYNRSKKGTYAADLLLGLANALAALNEKKAACDTLARMGNEFPQLRADLRDSAAQTRQRAGCR